MKSDRDSHDVVCNGPLVPRLIREESPSVTVYEDHLYCATCGRRFNRWSGRELVATRKPLAEVL